MIIRTYTYPAVFEAGDEFGVVVTFPDVPEAITQGADDADARAMAADALGTALLSYFTARQPLPEAAPLGEGQVFVTTDPDVSAKLAVLEAFHMSGLSKSELARRLGKDEREVRRILDPDHTTKLPALMATLAVLGRRLVVGVEAA